MVKSSSSSMTGAGCRGAIAIAAVGAGAPVAADPEVKTSLPSANSVFLKFVLGVGFGASTLGTSSV